MIYSLMYSLNYQCINLRLISLICYTNRLLNCQMTDICFSWLKHLWKQLHLTWKWFNLVCMRSDLNSISKLIQNKTMIIIRFQNFSMIFYSKWWIMNLDVRFLSVQLDILLHTTKNNKKFNQGKVILYVGL